jgi:hypothetical protein
MKLNKVLLFILCLLSSVPSIAQRIQFANNCPDNAFMGIDIYVDGNLFYDNLNFREATPFVDILPGSHTFSVAPDNSLSINDAFYSSGSLQIQPQDTIVAITTGTNTSIGYVPYKAVSINLYYGAREIALDPNSVDLLFSNGTTDAGKIDFRTGTDTWVNDLDLGNFSGYNEFLINTPKIFRVTNMTGSQAHATYDLTPPMIWAGRSGIVITTGFLNPQNNNNGPSFNTMVVFSDGGQFQPLTPTIPEAYARVQLIHNSADAMADIVDVYVNNDLLLDDVPFLTATTFMDAPANLPLDIGIAPKNSLSSTDTFYNFHTTFDSAKTYILVAHGIESATGYNPAPPFDIKVYNQAKETPSSGSTDILFMHGSTDKPGYSIDQGTNNWVSNIYDGDFSSSYTTKASNDYIITLKDVSNPNDTLRYNAALQTLSLSGKAITILGCGFKNPGNNSNGLPFKLYVATADGGNLIPLTIVTPDTVVSVGSVNSNTAINIFPNPAIDRVKITGLSANNNIIFYNMIGTVAKTVQNTKQGNVYVGDLPNGIYLLRITEDGKDVQQLKLIKE